MDAPTLILIIACVAVGILALFFLTLYFIYLYSFARRRDCGPFDGFDSPHMAPHKDRSHLAIKELLAVEYEEIYIDSPLDGTRLHAYFKDTGDSSPIQILCHGYRANPFRDFSGGALQAMKHGHGVLMIEQRAHHKSGGRTITFGIKEKYDLLGWVNYLHGRFPERDIIPVGISMGAATVIGLSALDLPDAVKCIVADCPFAVAKDEFSHAAKKMLGIPFELYPLIRLAAKIYGGFDPEDGDLRKSVAASRLPILIIHGEADKLVPIEMSRQLKTAAPDTVTHISFPDAHHGISYLVDRERYIAEFYGFIEKHLTRTGT
jgi:fermentation-respiration switch protein FrsA (DUF1100 family)